MKGMSDRQAKFWMWLASKMPTRFLYFAVIHVWARATTERFTDKHPDEVTWSMATKFLVP